MRVFHRVIASGLLNNMDEPLGVPPTYTAPVDAPQSEQRKAYRRAGCPSYRIPIALLPQKGQGKSFDCSDGSDDTDTLTPTPRI